MIHILRAAQQPASTWGAYHAAYTLAALIYAGYSVSLWVRGRRFRRALAQSRATPRG